MAHPVRLLLPWSVYGELRDQFGSVRDVYLKRDDVHRHNDLEAGSTPILLLHGFFQTRNLWKTLEERLRADGHSVLSFHLGSRFWRYNTRPVFHSAERVAQKMTRLIANHKLEGVHVIGHSMGGLIARTWIQQLGGHQDVRSLITLGTPHKGTPTAALAVGLMGFGLIRSSAFDLLPGSRTVRGLNRQTFPSQIPMLSIASKHDLVCPSNYCELPQPHKNIVLSKIGHTELALSEEVYAHMRAHFTDF